MKQLKATIVAALVGLVVLGSVSSAMAYAFARVEYRGEAQINEITSGPHWLYGVLSLYPGNPAKLDVWYAETGAYNLSMSTRCSDGRLQKTKRYGTYGEQVVLHNCGPGASAIRTQAALDDI